MNFGWIVVEGVVRGQYATVVLPRFTADTWQRITPTAGPAPKSSPLPGRAHVIQDGTHPTQVPLMTSTEAANRLVATAAGGI